MTEFLDAILDLIDWIKINGDLIMVTILAIVAGADKVALITLKTMANIRDAWRDYFGKDKV